MTKRKTNKEKRKKEVEEFTSGRRHKYFRKTENYMPRFNKGDRFLLFSNTYKVGHVAQIKVKHNKHVYICNFPGGDPPQMRLHEDQMLPYMKKFWWSILAFLRLAY